MRKRANKSWILAYLVGVGVFSSGITVACNFYSSGTFKELPSPFWGAWEDEDCWAEPWSVPRCGYYICTSSLCGTVSVVEGCTWAAAIEIFEYMQMGCRNEGCGLY
jgi:hypothetical protein